MGGGGGLWGGGEGCHSKRSGDVRRTYKIFTFSYNTVTFGVPRSIERIVT